jgi:hypothetical protein
MKHRAYLKLYAFDEKGEMTDIKNIIITQEGKIVMEEALGSKPQPENIGKEKPEYGR